MATLKSNIIANFLGQGWTALMGIAFIPLYIRYLGVEAYGLIGLFAVIQAWLALLDMGMSPTLGREMSRFTAGAHTSQSIRILLRSLEMIVYCLAVVIGLAIWAGSEWIARDWLRAEKLSVSVVANALSITAVVIALRFCEGIYRSALIGLQKQVWFNRVNALLATIRHGGALCVIAFVSPTIVAFFLWQALISTLTLAVFGGKLHRLLPAATAPVRFSSAAVKRIWQFAGGMLGISFLAILLTQVDKVLLSRLLTLEHFGYYTLAATVAGAICIVISPITQAIYPLMVELHTNKDEEELTIIYHRGAQFVTIVTVPAVCLIGLFPDDFLYLWSGNISLAKNTAAILAPMMLGSFFNGLMWMPYQCQLAHGWTGLGLKTNIVAVAVLIPAILWLVPVYGAVGAAWIWVCLNAGYVFIAIHFMHRRILVGEKWRWYRDTVFAPLITGSIAALAMRQWVQLPQERGPMSAVLACIAVLVTVVVLWSVPVSRTFFRLKIKGLRGHALNV